MSGKLAMQVLESALEATLKPLAVAAALFGNDAGGNIYPSVDRLAHLLTVTNRTVQRQLAQLRARRILVAQTALTGGRARTVHYRLDVDSLPTSAPFKRRGQRQGSREQPVSKKSDTVDPRTVTQVTDTLTSVTANLDTDVTRSVSDQSTERERSEEGEPLRDSPEALLARERPVTAWKD